MNKRQKEILQSSLDSEKETLEKLKEIYKKALDDVNDRIAALLGRTDKENLQSIIYQVQYQKALKTQITAILDNLNGQQFEAISEYLTKSYEDGFLGTLYDLHGQDIPLVFPIDQDQVVRAVQHDTKLSKPLYDRLGEDVSLLKKRIASDISRGVAQGTSYADIARSIAFGMVGDYSKMRGGALGKAITIAWTEGHRIQNEAAFDSQKKAAKKGADIVKQWDSTLDGRTRPHHRELDGQIRELDEPFEVAGRKAMYPGGFGVASEDIRCRCALLQQARLALEGGFTKMNNFTKQLETFDSPESYAEFKKAFFSKENVQYMNYVGDLEERHQTKDFEKLLGSMTEREYKHFKALEENNPIFNKKVLDNARNATYNDNGSIGIQFFANKSIPRYSEKQLNKSISSWESRIEEHKIKIANPSKFDSEWDSKNEEWKNGEIRHWQKEIAIFEDNIRQAEDELEKRGGKS